MFAGMLRDEGRIALMCGWVTQSAVKVWRGRRGGGRRFVVHGGDPRDPVMGAVCEGA